MKCEDICGEGPTTPSGTDDDNPPTDPPVIVNDPLCGNGVLENDESCDDGNTVSGDGCSSSCTLELQGENCGNGVVDTDEDCDPNASTNACTYGACRDDCTCPSDIGEFSFVKTDGVVCSADESYATVTYSATVKNIGGAVATVDKVIDSPDAQMDISWLVQTSVTPSAGFSVVGEELVWDLTGDMASFDPGESMTFTYSFNVPSDDFGTYQNIVTTDVSTSGVADATASNIANVGCNIPDNGLFDNTRGKIILGTGLVISAMLIKAFDGTDNLVIRLFGSDGRQARLARKKRKFEEKV